MPAATPTLEQVVAAVKTEIDAVNPASGTVLDSALKLESEREAIEAYQQADGTIDLWVVTSDGARELEGDAPGENYSLYRIVCRYWNVRVGDASWEKTARTQVETIRDRLNKNAAVFRISSQVQLLAPETASIAAAGFDDVEEMLAYKAAVVLEVEARRWT